MNDPSHSASQTELAQLRTRVTELEQALVMSQENEARLQFIVEGSNDGAWDWNMVTNEAFLSPRWFEMFGYAPNELPNNADTWFNSLHPDEAAWSVQTASAHQLPILGTSFGKSLIPLEPDRT